MGDKSERDNAPLTVGQVCLSSPKNIAKVLFFYVFLVMFRVGLTLIIKINIATIMNFDFHYRAMQLLHQIRALLSMKGIR